MPIGHVTNGVHIPTWLGDPMRELLDRHLGEGWMDRAADPATWDGARRRSPTTSCGPSGASSAPRSSTWARERSVVDRLGRGEPREYVEAAADFDPDVLTIGFARRLATYKRLDLLLQTPSGDRRLLARRAARCSSCSPARRTRATTTASAARAGLFAAKERAGVGRRVVFLDDYDLAHRRAAGARLRRLGQPPAPAAGGQRHQRDEVGGQRRPAAQRARRLVGRGLRRRQRLGAVAATSTTTTAPRTRATPPSCYRLLEDEVVPDVLRPRRATACRTAWLARVRASLRTLGPEFSATRMLRDYAERIYG